MPYGIARIIFAAGCPISQESKSTPNTEGFNVRLQGTQSLHRTKGHTGRVNYPAAGRRGDVLQPPIPHAPQSPAPRARPSAASPNSGLSAAAALAGACAAVCVPSLLCGPSKNLYKWFPLAGLRWQGNQGCRCLGTGGRQHREEGVGGQDTIASDVTVCAEMQRRGPLSFLSDVICVAS